MSARDAVISKLDWRTVCSQVHWCGCWQISGAWRLWAGDISSLPYGPLLMGLSHGSWLPPEMGVQERVQEMARNTGLAISVIYSTLRSVSTSLGAAHTRAEGIHKGINTVVGILGGHLRSFPPQLQKAEQQLLTDDGIYWKEAQVKFLGWWKYCIIWLGCWLHGCIHLSNLLNICA